MHRHSIWTDGNTELGRLQGAIPTPGGSGAQRRDYLAELARKAYRMDLRAEQEKMMANTPAPSTTATRGSHMRFFFEFCKQTGIDPGKFASNLHPSTEKLQKKDGVLIAFKQHASRAPRKAGKKNLAGTRKGRNTIGYASSCVSTARLYYERRVQRTVGLYEPNGRSSRRMLQFTKALAKLQPEPLPTRPPIMAENMLARAGNAIWREATKMLPYGRSPTHAGRTSNAWATCCHSQRKRRGAGIQTSGSTAGVSTSSRTVKGA